MSRSSTHVLFWTGWATFCAGGHPNAHFPCCHSRDSNQGPGSHNLNNKCLRPNHIGHLDPKGISKSRFSFFVFFYRFNSSFNITGLPLRSCRTIGAPSMQGSTQCPFSLLVPGQSQCQHGVPTALTMLATLTLQMVKSLVT